MKIEIIQADITKMEVDAIVNAANTSLLGGSGVDGAIHKAGGEQVLEECIAIRNRQGGCKVGEAVITGAGNLKAKYIIHTVGPVWTGGDKNEKELLRNCYLNTLKIAEENKIKTIAFPNISTGIYKFPKGIAAEIALEVAKENTYFDKIIFVCYELANYGIYTKILNNE